MQQRKTHERHPIAELIVRQPFVWGAVFVINFFALLYQGAFHSPLLSRYCAGHPIEIIELTVFFVGLAALLLRFCDIVGQFPSLRGDIAAADSGRRATGGRLRAVAGAADRAARRFRTRTSCGGCARRSNLFAARIRPTRSISICGTSKSSKAVRVNAAYSMVRIIIWAIPILGLLGTVIGITIAVANLNPETLEESMTKVTHGLGVAFDHTATALSLTMMLMFVKVGASSELEDRLAGTRG